LSDANVLRQFNAADSSSLPTDHLSLRTKATSNARYNAGELLISESPEIIFPGVGHLPQWLLPSPIASFGFNGKVPADETEGDKRRRTPCNPTFCGALVFGNRTFFPEWEIRRQPNDSCPLCW
jgi:hypothetical protein